MHGPQLFKSGFYKCLSKKKQSICGVGGLNVRSTYSKDKTDF